MTTAVMRGALFAQDKDYHSQYLNVVFEAIWQHNLKMDDPEIIKITLENAGLPATEIMDGAKQDEIKKGLFATTQAAVDRGAFGAPMMFVGDEPFFGKDSLDEMINWINNQSYCKPILIAQKTFQLLWPQANFIAQSYSSKTPLYRKKYRRVVKEGNFLSPSI